MSTAAVTTMNRDYYDLIGHRMLETYVRYWPRDCVLYVYTEGFDLPIQAPNIRSIDLYEAVGDRLQAYLDWRGQHYTRKFAYKAYAWIRAMETLDHDWLFYLDADTETKQPVTHDFLASITPSDAVLTYMYARATRLTDQGQEIVLDNAETCIYAWQRQHPFADRFRERYIEIYETREIGDSSRYIKCHDTWVMAECVRYAQQHGARVNNLHLDRNRRTPIKATVLWPYFYHHKGQKTKLQVASEL